MAVFPLEMGQNQQSLLKNLFKVKGLNFFLDIFFQPKYWPPSLGGLLQPWRPRKALVNTFRFFGVPTQKMLKYHLLLLKPHVTSLVEQDTNECVSLAYHKVASRNTCYYSENQL